MPKRKRAEAAAAEQDETGVVQLVEQAIEEADVPELRHHNDSAAESAEDDTADVGDSADHADDVDDHDSDYDADDGVEETPAAIKKPVKPLSNRRVEAYNESLRKRGIVYLSRVPPFMRPAKVKGLLEKYGAIARIYLVEEDASYRKKRKKMGGNRSKKWTEGWIEFEDKKIAKAVAANLNNCPIGGKKGDYYRDDLWNLKYLKHFKWDHLTEKVAYERRVREQKLRLETMQAKRESAAYLEMVEKGKAFKGMEGRKRAKGEPLPEGSDAVRRRFKQAQPVKDVGGGAMDKEVLRAVFQGPGSSSSSKADTRFS